MNSVRTGKAQVTVQQDGICCSSTKYHWTKTQGGTNAGAVGELGQPSPGTHMGKRGGCWVGPARRAEGPPLRLHLDWKVLVTEADPDLSRAPQRALKWGWDPFLSSSSLHSEEGPFPSTGVGKACITCFPVQSVSSTVPLNPGAGSHPPGSEPTSGMNPLVACS